MATSAAINRMAGAAKVRAMNNSRRATVDGAFAARFLTFAPLVPAVRLKTAGPGVNKPWGVGGLELFLFG